MATADPIPDVTPPPTQSGYALLVWLAPLPPEQLEPVIGRLATLFPPEDFMVASQNALSPESWPGIHIVPAPAANTIWTLTAADFVNVYQIAKQHEARNILMLGPECGSLTPEALRQLTNPILAGTTDLALPHYTLPPNTGLCASAAYSIPGNLTSRPNWALPSILAGVSVRGRGVPMILNWLLGFNFTSLGTGSCAAASASSP